MAEVARTAPLGVTRPSTPTTPAPAAEVKKPEPPRTPGTNRPMGRQIDARLEAERMRELYAQDPRQSSFRALIIGEGGTGKTSIASTARLPIHIDSFDPGGTKPLRNMIIAGDVVVDTRYESEDPLTPSAFDLWTKTFMERVRGDYFSKFGTYFLDSSTLWADSIMNWILSKENIAGSAPRFTRDYTPQKVQIRNWMKRILDLPCDVIVTGHMEDKYESKIIAGEEVRVLSHQQYMTTGQGAILIPLLFDEVWITIVQERATKVEHKIVTSKFGKVQGKTRIGARKFDVLEVPDIKALLRKAGWKTEDKPKLF